jgi:fused signal recognition particle receptor
MNSDIQKSKGWFSKLKEAMQSSASQVSQGLNHLVNGKKPAEEIIHDLEDLLLSSDIGVKLTNFLIDQIRSKRFLDEDSSIESIKQFLAELMIEVLQPLERCIQFDHRPTVILTIGVNASGKTTTVGKLANLYASENKKVRLVAADTFRAGAVEQLKVWGARASVPVEAATESKSDPNTLIYKGYEKSHKENDDVLLVDTAGRLHNKSTLMEELSKTVRTIQKINTTAPHYTLLVVDANIGQNALAQVTMFNEAAKLNGLIITKLDGSAKAGIVLQLAKEYRLPIYYLGVGEAIDDLQPFDAKAFVNNLLDIDPE